MPVCSSIVTSVCLQVRKSLAAAVGPSDLQVDNGDVSKSEMEPGIVH